MNEDMELFHQYEKLAYKIASEFSKSKPWIRDEIESAALYGLWEATKKEAEGNPVSFYSTIIRNQVIYQTKKLDKHITLGSGPTSDYQKQFHNIKMISTSPSEQSSDVDLSLDYEITTSSESFMNVEEILIHKEREVRLQKAIDELSKEQQFVIRSLLKGDSVKEISFEKGCSKQNINVRKAQAISYLKEKLN